MAVMKNFYEFPDRKSLAEKLAGEVATLLEQGIKQKGRASLAVSGGTTPVDLFEQLSGIDLPWNQVVVFLVDERWVGPDDPDSNERLVRKHLLKDKAKSAQFLGMKNSAATAGEGEAECEERLKRVPLPFDVLILGMGGDGHTASLFPGAEKLPAATDMNSSRTCMALAPPAAPHERMSLTLPVILSAKNIFLHIVGQEKRKVLEKAMGEGPSEDMPIRFVLRYDKNPVTIYWAPL